MSRFQTAWVPVIACATLIFALSGIPSLSSGLGVWDLVLRKIAHVSIYAVLGALLVRAFRGDLPALATGIAYAVSDEVHQHFVPGRSGAPLDVGFDALGVIAGVYLLRWARRRDAARGVSLRPGGLCPRGRRKRPVDTMKAQRRRR